MLLVSLGILAYLFSVIPLSAVAASLASASALPLLLAYLLQLAMRAFAASRLALLANRQGISLSVGSALDIGFATIFYGLFLPGEALTGGFIRWRRLARPEGKPAEALVTIFFDRTFDTLVLLATGLAFWAAEGPSGQGLIGLALGIALATLMAAFLVMRFEGFSPHPALDPFRRLPFSVLVPVLGLSLGYHLLGALSFSAFALSMDLPIPFIAMGWIRSVVLILTMLPISISGIGVREGALLFVLSSRGVPPAAALGLSLLFFSGKLFTGAIGGALEARKLLRPRTDRAPTS